MSEPGERSARALARLDQITRRLRRECPWDREQDERSIVPHTVEEAYELADAVERSDDDALLDELGDVLFQVHFLALLLEERGAGDLEAVAEGAVEKLIRRHPHVFGAEASAEASRVLERRPGDSAGAVLRNWDAIKREVERRGGGDPFADVPENLPALLYARKLLRRASGATEGAGGDAGSGPPAADHRAALARAAEALAELDAAAPPGALAGAGAEEADRDAIESALGEVLLALADASRLLRVDPELALRASARRLRDAQD